MPVLATSFALAAANDQKGQEKPRHDPEDRLHCCLVHRSSPFVSLLAPARSPLLQKFTLPLLHSRGSEIVAEPRALASGNDTPIYATYY